MTYENVKYAKSYSQPNNLKDIVLYILAPFFAGWFVTGGIGWGILCAVIALFGIVIIRIVTMSNDWGKRFDQAKAHMAKQGFQTDFAHPPRLAIDSKNRKLALVSPGAGSYDFYDLSDILGWEHTWVDKSTPRIGVTGRATGMTYTKEDNLLVIKTNNPHNPLYEFPIGSHDNGQLWLARLNALINR